MGDAGLGAIALFQGASSLSTAISSSGAVRAQGAYESTVAKSNQSLAEIQAEDAIRRGDKAAAEHGKAVRSLMGKQKAALAAQGIDVSSGSSADILNDTNYLGTLDALTIKNNAAREAFGYKSQAIGYGSQANFADLSTRNLSRSTLLTGGMSALSSGLTSGYYLTRGGFTKDASTSDGYGGIR